MSHFTKGAQFAYIFSEELFCSDERKSATANIRVYDSEKTEEQVRKQEPVERVAVEFHGEDYDKYVLPDNDDLDVIGAGCIDVLDRNGEKTMEGWVHNI